MGTRTGFRALLAAALLAACLVPARSAESGTPRVDPQAGTIDVIVYFENDAITAAQLTSWEQVFTAWSKRLYDVTDRQLRLGVVRLTTSKSLADRADVFVAKGAGDASAHLDGVHKRGRYIKIFDQRHNLDTSDNQGSFGLVHESGHYFFGLYDEYRGCARAENGACASALLDVRLQEGGPASVKDTGRPIAGRVYEDGGTVPDRFDTGDTPLAGVTLRLRRVVPGQAPTEAGRISTGADGTFFFPFDAGRPAGQYQLEVLGLDGTLPSGAPNPYSSEAYVVADGVVQTLRTEHPALPLALERATLPLTVDLPLVMGKPMTTQNMLGGSFHGRIYTKPGPQAPGTCDDAANRKTPACVYHAASDTLVPGVQVLLWQVLEDGSARQAGLHLTDAATAAGDSYAFHRLPLGGYRVELLGLAGSPLTATGYVEDFGLGPVFNAIPGALKVDPEAPTIAKRLDETDQPNPTNATLATKTFFCAAREGQAGCVMDGGTLTSLGGRNQRTEFCSENGTAASGTLHRVTETRSGQVVSTTQDWVHGHSCWRQVELSAIARDFEQAGRSLAMPGGIPTSDTTGFAPPQYRRVLADMAVVLLVDTSFSMDPDQRGDEGSRLGLARRGARSAVDLMGAGERLAIIPFGTTVAAPQDRFPQAAGLRFDPIPKDTPNGRNEYKEQAGAYLDALQADGWTAMGDALRAALDTVDALSETDVANKAIVLLSDGYNTLGSEQPDDVLADIKKAINVEVHTIALGPDADRETLQRIAFESGGTFQTVASAADLAQAFQRVIGAARGDQPVVADFAAFVPGGSAVVVPVEVSALAEGATFLVSYASGAPLEFELEAPDGTVIRNDGWGIEAAGVLACDGSDCSPSNPVHASGVEFVENPAQQFYRLPDVAAYDDPVAGPQGRIWKLGVSSRGPDVVPFAILVSEQARGVIATAEIENGSIVYPEPVRLAVAVGGNLAIGGARVTARVVPPGSTPAAPVSYPLTLHDDGRPEHGDAQANDGVYSALFARYTPASEGGGDGRWLFEVTADDDGGRAYEVAPGEDSPLEAALRPVPPFTLRASATALVTGIPDPLPTGGLALTDGTALPLPTPVPKSRLAVTPVLGFSLAAGAEAVDVGRLVLHAEWNGPTALPEVGLFLDADQDGVADTPARPLARTLFAGGLEQTAVFDAGLVLARIPADSTRHFVVALGAPAAADGAGGTLAPRPAPRLPRTPPGPGLLGVLLALAAALAWVGLRTWAPRRAPALVFVLLFALQVGFALGCGGGDPDPPGETPRPTGGPDVFALALRLDPAEVVARGATSGESVSVQGSPLEVGFAVEVDDV